MLNFIPRKWFFSKLGKATQVICNVEYNLKTKVFGEFVKQIAVELALLYVQKASRNAPQKAKDCVGAIWMYE